MIAGAQSHKTVSKLKGLTQLTTFQLVLIQDEPALHTY